MCVTAEEAPVRWLPWHSKVLVDARCQQRELRLDPKMQAFEADGRTQRDYAFAIPGRRALRLRKC